MNVNCLEGSKHFHTVSFDSKENIVILINQKKLPHQFSLVKTTDFYQTAAAIQDMTVRGAGAIGATAAFGFAQGCNSFKDNSLELFEKHWKKVFNTLAKARPTAVDPVNAMRNIIDKMKSGTSVESQQQIALEAAYQFAEDDIAHCVAIGQYGSPLIQDGMTLLTHCNAGWLAFVDIGSATAPIYTAHKEGKRFQVFCDETRPRFQGAVLTAWELAQQGIPHRVIPDNAAGHFMQRGQIQMVITGADRVLAKTGEAANKIGTFSKAVLAKYHNIPFYIAIPLSTIDWQTEKGTDIPIEERDEDEVLCAWGAKEPSTSSKEYIPQKVRIANSSSHALNPGFDITPAELITGFITPFGIFSPKELGDKIKELLSVK